MIENKVLIITYYSLQYKTDHIWNILETNWSIRSRIRKWDSENYVKLERVYEKTKGKIMNIISRILLHFLYTSAKYRSGDQNLLLYVESG